MPRRAFPPVLIWVSLLIGIGLCILGGRQLLQALKMALDLQAYMADTLQDPVTIALLVLLYIALLAIPFMPGIELGLLLLMIFGARIAPLLYLATVCALLLAYGLGRCVPLRRLRMLLSGLGLKRAARMLRSRETNPGAALPASAHPVLGPLLRYRCVALAVLLNLPGNTVLGGGGGIALAVGAGRLIRPWAFGLTVLVAVAPVPLLVMLGASVPWLDP